VYYDDKLILRMLMLMLLLLSLLLLMNVLYSLSLSHLTHCIKPQRLRLRLYSSSSSSIPPSSSSSSSSSSNPLKLKVRQHVNPLALKYQIPIKLQDDWLLSAYNNPNRPFVIDIGCAKGTWALNYAKRNPDVNVLGLEIRRPVVEFANKRKHRWGLSNVHFLSCNANIDLDRILSTITGVPSEPLNQNQSIFDKIRSKNKNFQFNLLENKENDDDNDKDDDNNDDNDDLQENDNDNGNGDYDYEKTLKAYNDFLISNLQSPIDFSSGSNTLFRNFNENNNEKSYIKIVTLQFPDPHFKAKHKKRRVMNDKLVDTITKHIQQNTPIFVQSDILEVLEDIVETLSSSTNVSPAPEYSINQLDDNINPVGIMTEREIATLAKKLPVYRMLFYRK